MAAAAAAAAAAASCRTPDFRTPQTTYRAPEVPAATPETNFRTPEVKVWQQNKGRALGKHNKPAFMWVEKGANATAGEQSQDWSTATPPAPQDQWDDWDSSAHRMDGSALEQACRRVLAREQDAKAVSAM